MPHLKKILNPGSYVRLFRRRLQDRRLRLHPNLRGAATYPPGHFYSPLLDIENLGPDSPGLPHDGAEYWEHVDLRREEQRAYFVDLLERFPPDFPRERTAPRRYFSVNTWFPPADAFTLAGVIQREQPKRIIEIGSGFSSAVMLDTLAGTRECVLTFIEPNPGRLYSLLTDDDRGRATILVKGVQDVPLETFEQLEAHDLLFIDSSHVAKVGSDVTYLLLRVLPRLRPGVLVHFHDVVYPYSYPALWLREGRAWNESLFLRAFLIGNAQFRVVAFNAFAAQAFPEVFRERFAVFLRSSGSSIWLRKMA
jgi:predicted O-methyltransferase YrrM